MLSTFTTTFPIKYFRKLYDLSHLSPLLPKNPTPPKFTNSATGFPNLPPMDPPTLADAVLLKPSSESTPPPLNPDSTVPPKPSSESTPPPPYPDPTVPPKPSSESTPPPPYPDPTVPHKSSSESIPPPANPGPAVPSPATDRTAAEKMETLKIDPVAATAMPAESNPYVAPSSPAATPASSKVTMEKVKSVLGWWGKKVGETAKKTEVLAGNTWQHLRTGPSFADAAMGRISQGTKVLAEGGYEKIFRNTFETLPEEQLMKTFACYLSTSAGPVMGVLYLSTAKLAFCSDNPLSYKNGETTEWTYYKVVIPLNQLLTVCPSASKVNAAEKYIQVVSVDNHEFWFLGFVNYDSAVKNLQEALVDRKMPSAPILP